MEQKNNTYKILSIVLAVIAIIFAVLYFTKKGDTVTETFDTISEKTAQCQMKIAEWQKTNGAKVTTTQEEKDELKDILADCQDTFGQSQERI